MGKNRLDREVLLRVDNIIVIEIDNLNEKIVKEYYIGILK